MLKKTGSLILSIVLIVALFCGTTVKANSVDSYYENSNRLVLKTDESRLTNIDESFKMAKENAVGLKLILDDVTVDFSATYVLNTTPKVLTLTVTENEKANGVKAYNVSGVLDGLLKTNHNGTVEITFPFESKNGTPIIYNINSDDEINLLYTTYNREEKTVTARTDYFGDFYITDAEESDFNYGKTALSLTDNSEEYLYLYEKIEDGVTDFDETISFDTKTYKITTSELSVAFNTYKYDHPEFFANQIDSSGNNLDYTYSYSWNGTYVYSITPNYGITKAQYKSYMAQIETVADELIDGIDIDKIGEYEASKILYERLCDHVTYLKNSSFCHTIYGSLVNGFAVCDGYARAYQYLLNKLGILAHTVTGYSYNPSTGVGEAHAWNLVRINGEFYYTDVTWADQGDRVFYGYLNCNYDDVTKDHQFDDPGFELPSTTATKDNYYVVTGFSIDYDKISSQNIINLINKQGPTIQFKVNNYEGNALINDVNTKFNENQREILYDVLRMLNYRSMGIGISCLGKELVVRFYDSNLSDFPTELTISGDMVIGNTLTVATKDSSYSNILDNMVWCRNGVPIDNAKNKSYILTASDIDSYISVVVFTSSYNGAKSYQSTALVSNQPILSGSVTVKGTAKVGETLTAIANLNTTSGLKYQWYRNESIINGANSSSYKLTKADAENTVYCVITANGYIGSVTSNSIFDITDAEFTAGDINSDNTVNSKDLTLLRRYLADWDVSVNEAALDINKDGKTNSKDITYLARSLADWEDYELN